MPELPEMENYKTQLNQKVGGILITGVAINRVKSINVKPDEFVKKVKNQKVKAINRRAKYLLFHLQNGDILLLHLMLSGLMFYGTENEKPNRTVQIKLSFGEQHLYFIGLRLGYLRLLSQEQVEQKLVDLGPEPLNVHFSINSFLKLIDNRRGRLKTTIVNQEFLSGIGNRYSDEIAWHAQLLPERKMDEIHEEEKIQLYQSIRFILQQGIKNGGNMDYPLFLEDTKTGGYNNNTYVYGREGEAFSRCGAIIVQEEISSRKTFYCNGCQM